MARIVTIGAKADERALRSKTKLFPFQQFHRNQVDELIREMRRSMKEANGIGLSANQIGYDFRVFVAQVPDQNGHMKFYSLFNPTIEQLSAEQVDMEEGCLSVPGVYGTVKRPARLTLTGSDKLGKHLKIKAWGLLARVIQHEIDHLNGRLFIDVARDIHREINEKKSTQ